MPVLAGVQEVFLGRQLGPMRLWPWDDELQVARPQHMVPQNEHAHVAGVHDAEA